MSRFCSSGLWVPGVGGSDPDWTAWPASGRWSSPSLGSSSSRSMSRSSSSSSRSWFFGSRFAPEAGAERGVEPGSGDTPAMRPSRSPRSCSAMSVGLWFEARLAASPPALPFVFRWPCTSSASSSESQAWPWLWEWPAPRVVRYDSRATTTRAETIAIRPGIGL